MSETRLRVERGGEVTQLLVAIREDLEADSSVMLLLDATRSVLEPVAACGLDETLRTSARVPLGQGFAGTIAATAVPLVLDEVRSDNVVNPMLHRRGIRSLVGVPLLSDGMVIGVLHVGSLTPRTFTQDDIERLAARAEDLAVFVKDRALVEEHVAALVLQRSLIPTVPPRIPGLDIAGRYLPAEGDLGGDWYDVFSLPGGRVGIVMGDVLGHGLGSAVIMGRVRSALRAYALIEESPARVLEMLDHKIDHFEAGMLATVVFAVASAPFDTFTVSSAGHWAPLLAGDGAVAQVDVPHDPLLGVEPATRRTEVQVSVEPGEVLCFFTDGMIEQRIDPGAAIDPDRGIALVAANLSAALTAEANCISILAGAMPAERNRDDIALLVVRRDPDA
ncbi:PP2C family protein-serine/threonine phosphatase [Aeromicrobium wangtongii]|uniref:SpoIIE family protein phosphatase n=1 Tax=Aeromicrobium wangtongii TaxID=2969247 RepID=A0ABY5MAQ4_9ACTN|nr:GAF domain-containing SpoIIE family protein phosphatase [Aeromicrobium wangtongii]MCD9196711.1 SpoIIE family protein phosphatase [Aeromicrobium wangtongii]UUP14221.1 SpoIIE family protein phosphatase [Aeromicrobium wangtongii]